MKQKQLKRIISYLLSVIIIILLFICLIFAKKYLDKRAIEREQQEFITTLESMLLCRNYGGILEKTTSLDKKTNLDEAALIKYIEVGNAYEYLIHITENINLSQIPNAYDNCILWLNQLNNYVLEKTNDDIVYGNESYLLEMQKSGKEKIIEAFGTGGTDPLVLFFMQKKETIQ